MNDVDYDVLIVGYGPTVDWAIRCSALYAEMNASWEASAAAPGSPMIR